MQECCHQVQRSELDADAIANAHALIVSMDTLAGIWMYHTLLLPVMIKGARFLTLLDNGSTHIFF